MVVSKIFIVVIAHTASRCNCFRLCSAAATITTIYIFTNIKNQKVN